jgi:argininosuccinate lyase
MDYQETKRPFMEALDLVQDSLEICTLVVGALSVNIDRLIAACTFELFAADRAYDLATVANLPFRDAYRIVGAEVTALLDRRQPLPVESQEQLVARLAARNHLGGAGNLGLAEKEEQLGQVKAAWTERAAKFMEAITKLVGEE